MRFLHSMIRVKDLEESLNFFVNCLGLKEMRRKEVPSGKFTLVFLKAPISDAEIELTYNWDQEEEYSQGRNFGHLAFEVDDIYRMCSELEEKGIAILRPPRDGHMAFVKSPDGISIELLQKGDPLAVHEKWANQQNQGSW